MIDSTFGYTNRRGDLGDRRSRESVLSKRLGGRSNERCSRLLRVFGTATLDNIHT
jgi:hypothetical protein